MKLITPIENYKEIDDSTLNDPKKLFVDRLPKVMLEDEYEYLPPVRFKDGKPFNKETKDFLVIEAKFVHLFDLLYEQYGQEVVISATWLNQLKFSALLDQLDIDNKEEWLLDMLSVSMTHEEKFFFLSILAQARGNATHYKVVDLNVLRMFVKVSCRDLLCLDDIGFHFKNFSLLGCMECSFLIVNLKRNCIDELKCLVKQSGLFVPST